VAKLKEQNTGKETPQMFPEEFEDEQLVEEFLLPFSEQHWWHMS
jgi:hypothetical protein